MYRRSYRHLAALSLLALASGCVQMTRHSNTMVFGTNTTVGLKVGQDPNQVPEVVIGYDRQEAVIMPLLANTGERPGADGLMSPCRPVSETTTESTNQKAGTKTIVTEKMDSDISFGGDGEASVHPCKFVAVRADKGGIMIQDSYSVLASFGAQIEGSAPGGTGSVGLSQYFATGVAAQILAATGGAALVAVGKAAEESAKSEGKAAAAAAVLGETQTYPAGSGISTASARNALIGKLDGMSDEDVRTKAPAFIDSLTIMDAAKKTDFKKECAKGQSACKKFVIDNPQIFSGLRETDLAKL
jgi:hypothetical protein